VAAICHEGDAVGTEGSGVRETDARILRAFAGRSTDPDQSRFLRGVALPHLQDDHRQFDDL